jgi:hypothetical protein
VCGERLGRSEIRIPEPDPIDAGRHPKGVQMGAGVRMGAAQQGKRSGFFERHDRRVFGAEKATPYAGSRFRRAGMDARQIASAGTHARRQERF